MTLRVRLCHLSVTAAVAAMLAVPHPAKGAVRVCKGPIFSVVAIEKSEKAGKRRALDDWKAKAGLFGMDYTSWRLAADNGWPARPSKATDMHVLRTVLRASSSRYRRSPGQGPSPFPAEARVPPTPVKIRSCNGRTRV